MTRLLAACLIGTALMAVSFSAPAQEVIRDRKSTRLNSSHANISYAVFCLKKKKALPSRSNASNHHQDYHFMFEPCFHHLKPHPFLVVCMAPSAPVDGPAALAPYTPLLCCS